MKRAFPFLVLSAILLAPAFASAQSVMVLGIRSMEGDDEFTRNLTGALRHAASQVEGWEVSEREVTFTQMALVYDCDNPNPACLTAIAESLEVQRLIYGDVQRTSGGEDYDFSVNLHHFNTATSTIEHSVADTVASVHRDIDDLREPANRWIQNLAGAPRTGALVVRTNVPGASVSVDGAPVGVTDDSGNLRVEDLDEGSRDVEVTAEGYTSFSGAVTVEAFGEVSLEGTLAAGADGGGGSFPTELVVGTTLLIAAAGFAAVWAWAGITVFGHMNSEEFNGVEGPDGRLMGGIRGNYGEGVDNICETAGTPRQQEICDEAATLEVLQFVFMGLTALSGVLGIYFIAAGASGGDDEADAEAARIELVPSVGPNHAYFGARVRF